MHLINDGVTVNGDTATVEFAGSGPTTTFRCRLDRQSFSPCELVHVQITWAAETDLCSWCLMGKPLKDAKLLKAI